MPVAGAGLVARPRLWAAMSALAVLLPACAVSPPVKTVSLVSLEVAPIHAVVGGKRYVVSDPAALKTLCIPLGPRLGLLQVRSAGEWQLLSEAVPGIGPSPDLRRGTLVGIVCWAGTPIDGTWPVRLDAVRVCSGGGLMTATFQGGTYLPDGTVRLETDYVEGLRSVLVVDVNGTSFYPDDTR